MGLIIKAKHDWVASGSNASLSFFLVYIYLSVNHSHMHRDLHALQCALCIAVVLAFSRYCAFTSSVFISYITVARS